MGGLPTHTATITKFVNSKSWFPKAHGWQVSIISIAYFFSSVWTIMFCVVFNSSFLSTAISYLPRLHHTLASTIPLTP